MARAHVGCSGWEYRDWRGVVYPAELPQRRWFEHYATLFDTVEINNTFYRLPPPSTVEGWAAQAPPGFIYASKLGQFGSHRMKLRDAGRGCRTTSTGSSASGRHLGPTLVQLPPRWRRNVERLDEFLTVAPKHIRWAVELREPSWVHDDMFDLLARHGAAFCVHDLLADYPWVRTTDWTYVRFHGPNALDGEVPGPLRRAPAVAAGRAARGVARRGVRRLRVLQQRLRGPRRRRRAVARAAPRRVNRGRVTRCRCSGASCPRAVPAGARRRGRS